LTSAHFCQTAFAAGANRSSCHKNYRRIYGIALSVFIQIAQKSLSASRTAAICIAMLTIHKIDDGKKRGRGTEKSKVIVAVAKTETRAYLKTKKCLKSCL